MEVVKLHIVREIEQVMGSTISNLREVLELKNGQYIMKRDTGKMTILKEISTREFILLADNEL